jgi:hypothetical protein
MEWMRCGRCNRRQNQSQVPGPCDEMREGVAPPEVAWNLRCRGVRGILWLNAVNNFFASFVANSLQTVPKLLILPNQRHTFRNRVKKHNGSRGAVLFLLGPEVSTGGATIMAFAETVPGQVLLVFVRRSRSSNSHTTASPSSPPFSSPSRRVSRALSSSSVVMAASITLRLCRRSRRSVQHMESRSF